jgi:hypothetical protein
MINPEVLEPGRGSWTIEEGCLSIPEIREEVDRAEKDLGCATLIPAAFNVHELSAEGLLGRVILHEIDHLNGVLFLDHLGAVKRKLLRGEAQQARAGGSGRRLPDRRQLAAGDGHRSPLGEKASMPPTPGRLHGHRALRGPFARDSGGTDGYMRSRSW